MNAHSISQQTAPNENQALIPTKPYVVQVQELVDRYAFDDVLAMRFGIEDGTQLLISGMASQDFLEFTQPLRLTQQDRNHPLTDMGN